MSFSIFVDGSSNLPGSVLQELNIEILPCSYTLNGQPGSYNGRLDTFNAHEYYAMLRQGGKVQTSLLNTQLFLDSFRPVLEQGRDVLYFSMSGGISGTCQAAKIAATELLEDFPEIEQYVSQTLGQVNTSLMDWIQNTVLPKLGSLISNVTSGVYYAIMGVYNLVIGIIVSVYVLSNLEQFGASAKRILYSVFSVDIAKKILEGLEFTDRTFMGFINGKLLDSAIIGLICYIVCSILRMPYALLVSVIVGVTNIIPFFGPFIGAVPSSIIILLVNPVKCLIFIAFIILLQQLDGNIIGPKILGSSVGINGFWVMFSIILGAGLFGFWGMLLGVPVFVIIYAAITGSVTRKLKRSDLPWEAADYMDMAYIDPVTYQPVKKHREEETEDQA